MVKSLELNKILFEILSNKTNCNDRLYPIVAENGTNYPFMVYTRDNVTGEYCKDGLYTDSVSFTINIVSSTYFESVEVAQRTRELLDHPVIKIKDVVMRDVQLISASERFEEDAYIQTLQFIAIITNN